MDTGENLKKLQFCKRVEKIDKDENFLSGNVLKKNPLCLKCLNLLKLGRFIAIDMSFGNWLIYLRKECRMRDYCTWRHLFIGYWYLRYMYVATKFKRMMHIVFNAISVILLKWVGYVIKKSLRCCLKSVFIKMECNRNISCIIILNVLYTRFEQ